MIKNGEWNGTKNDRQPRCVVSGGQTGVDRAALDAAMAVGLAVSGWCPAGRWAEDGAVPDRYPLRETPTSDPAQRTEWNIRDSDGTLVLGRGNLQGGTALTVSLAKRLQKPYLVVDVDRAVVSFIRQWLARRRMDRLNVAGPRESQRPGIYAAAYSLLDELFSS